MQGHEGPMALLCDTVLSAGLRRTSLATIARSCRYHALRAGQVVFMEGDSCRDLHLLLQGHVVCYLSSLEGREQVLKQFDRRGDAFCFTSAFATARYVASARAVSDVRLYRVSVDAITSAARDDHALAMRLVTATGGEAKHLVTVAGDLSLKNATSRLARALMERATIEGRRGGAGIELSRRHVREDDLAAAIGAVRVHVSRSLQRLARAGAINLDRRRIVIRDVGALERLAKGA